MLDCCLLSLHNLQWLPNLFETTTNVFFAYEVIKLIFMLLDIIVIKLNSDPALVYSGSAPISLAHITCNQMHCSVYGCFPSLPFHFQYTYIYRKMFMKFFFLPMVSIVHILQEFFWSKHFSTGLISSTSLFSSMRRGLKIKSKKEQMVITTVWRTQNWYQFCYIYMYMFSGEIHL